MSALRFITITRRSVRGTEDTSSLSLAGRITTPGFVSVVGGLEHNSEFAPHSEADRLALLEWILSDTCKAVAQKGGAL